MTATSVLADAPINDTVASASVSTIQAVSKELKKGEVEEEIMLIFDSIRVHKGINLSG